jgi:hypothetical protein
MYGSRRVAKLTKLLPCRRGKGYHHAPIYGRIRLWAHPFMGAFIYGSMKGRQVEDALYIPAGGGGGTMLPFMGASIYERILLWVHPFIGASIYGSIHL